MAITRGQIAGWALAGALHERWTRACPVTHKAVAGRKFLLPKYRQGHYASQDELNRDFEVTLISMLIGAVTYQDDVQNAGIANMFHGLKYDRPILFLEQELGQAFMEQKLPLDMTLTDIQWRWPQLRIMLPVGLVTIERAGVTYSANFLDLCYVDKEPGAQLPARYAEELTAFRHRHLSELDNEPIPPIGKVMIYMGEPHFNVCAQINFSELGLGPTHYSFIAPWREDKIAAIMGYRGGLKGGFELDGPDEIFIDKLRHLAMSVLLFLSATKFEYAPDAIERKFALDGKHMRPELQRAKFVGASQIKAVMLGPRPEGAHTGMEVSPHWRSGHWHRVVCGKGRLDRKYVWFVTTRVRADLDPVEK